jgi:hypothetical protein
MPFWTPMRVRTGAFPPRTLKCGAMVTARAIQDEFTALPVPERKKTELRRRRDGLCVRCGQPVATKFYCLAHAEANREKQRKLKTRTGRNLNARSYRAAQS